MTKDGSIYTGCNVESVNLSNSLHAEEVAVAEAVKDGRSEFEVLAVSTWNGAAPCGMCRQTLSEFCDETLSVLVDSIEDDDVVEHELGELYPHPFSEL